MKFSSPGNQRKNTFILYMIIYATMLLFGLVENIRGVSLPLIKAQFGVNYESQGGLVSLTWFGYVVFCLIASLFLQRYGIKRSILAGYLAVMLGALATMAAPTFWAATGSLVMVNTGFGFFEVGANALASVVFISQAALKMNLMHFFYGFGAITGPKIAGTLIDTYHLTWQQVYLAIILPTAALFLFILSTRFHGRAGDAGTRGEHAADDRSPRLSFWGALRFPVVWLFCITLGFMEVIEFGAATWGGLYLKDVYGLDPSVTGANFVSLFYIQFTLARLFGGLLIEKIGYMRSLAIATVGAMLLFLIGFGLGPAGIWVLPSTGLFIGIMWPTMIAVAMRFFGLDAPIITSVIITISGAVNGIFQYGIGLTNALAGEAWGYQSLLIYAAVTMVLLYILDRQMRRPYQATAVPAPADQPV